MNKITTLVLLFITYSLLLITSSCKPDLEQPSPSAGHADFSRFIAIGGDFMAGYQDAALYKKGQKNSIPALLAQQFKSVSGGTFNQPLMPDYLGLGLNVKPWESEFNTPSSLNYKTDCKGVSSLSPLKINFSKGTAGIYLQPVSGSFQNVSVPFAKVVDYTNPALGSAGNSNPYFKRFAQVPGTSTMLSDVTAQQPTFFAIWAGMEDIFDYVSHGATGSSVYSSSSFSSDLDSILSKINTHGVIANIPDFTCFPFYTTVPWNSLDLTKNLKDSLNMLYHGDPDYPGGFKIGKNGFMIEDPNATLPPAGYRRMVEGDYILLTIPLDSMKCNNLGTFTPMPDGYVIDTSEVKYINQIISEYNAVIAAKAQQYNLALVDMNSYFKSVKTGIKWDGADYNTEFVSGGFFSLDGYHPNQKGYALIANEFIKAINLKYNSTIPWVNCTDCDGILFP